MNWPRRSLSWFITKRLKPEWSGPAASESCRWAAPPRRTLRRPDVVAVGPARLMVASPNHQPPGGRPVKVMVRPWALSVLILSRPIHHPKPVGHWAADAAHIVARFGVPTSSEATARSRSAGSSREPGECRPALPRGERALVQRQVPWVRGVHGAKDEKGALQPPGHAGIRPHPSSDRQKCQYDG